MQGVTTTPNDEASVILGQIVSSKFDFSQDISLVGRDSPYWRFKAFCSFYGLLDHPWAIMTLGVLKDRAMSSELSSAPMLLRMSSCLPDDSIQFVQIDTLQKPPEGPYAGSSGRTPGGEDRS